MKRKNFDKLPWKKVNTASKALELDDDATGFMGLEELDGSEFDLESFKPIKKPKLNDFYAQQYEKRKAEKGEKEETSDTEDIPTKKGKKQKPVKKEKTKEKTKAKAKAGKKGKPSKEEEEDEEDEIAEVEEVKEEKEEIEEKELTPEEIEKQEKKKATKAHKKKKQKQKQKAAEIARLEEAETKKEELKTSVEDIWKDMEEWERFTLREELIRGLHSLKFFKPTPIQAATLLPAILSRKDIIGAAQTGSGKTLSYGIPILQRLIDEANTIADKMQTNEDEEEQSTAKPFDQIGLKALILCPTRELSIQVSKHLQQAAKFTDIKIATIVGGMYIEKQKKALARRPHILVATPGRFWALFQEGNEYLNETLKDLWFLVVDEADRMIEEGHYKELDSLFEYISQQRVEQPAHTSITRDFFKELKKPKTKDEDGEDDDEEEEDRDDYHDVDDDEEEVKQGGNRQTFVFSATISAFGDVVFKKRFNDKKKKKKKEAAPLTPIEKLLKKIPFQRKVEIVDFSSKQVVPETLHQAKITCLFEEKDYYLFYLLSQYGGRTLVFVNSIECAHHLAPFLALLKLPVFSLHARLQQKQRLRALEKINKEERAIIVATDVAARGLDIPRLEHVIHYQLPRSLELYVHRSGRTARANASGLTVMLVDPKERKYYTKIVTHLLQGQEPEDYPVDLPFLTQVRKRVDIAKELDNALHRLNKSNVDRTWLERTAKEADLDYDDEIDPEEESERKFTQKLEIKRIDQLKAQLKAVLAKPIVPLGTSQKYITKTAAIPNLLVHDHAKPKAWEVLKKKK